MAAATKFENIWVLADTNTLAGPGVFNIAVTAGSGAAAVLTLTVGSSAIVLAAPAGSTVELHSSIKLGGNVTATVALSGAGATAYAIDRVGR
jgi:hypothetical protein